MQNYRNNAMPYNTYRQTQMPSRMDCLRMDEQSTIKNMTLAMAYVPWQTWRDIYDAEKAFCRGTIFEELDKPFLGKGGVKR